MLLEWRPSRSTALSGRRQRDAAARWACPPVMGGSPYRAVLRGAERVWHDLRFKDLYRSGKEFELMQRALGFAALAILTVIPLLIVVAAANPAPHRGLAGWVVYGMGLTGSSADAVTRLFSAPARVLGTTSVFSALVLSVSGVAFGGQRAGRVREDLGPSRRAVAQDLASGGVAGRPRRLHLCGGHGRHGDATAGRPRRRAG